MNDIMESNSSVMNFEKKDTNQIVKYLSQLKDPKVLIDLVFKTYAIFEKIKDENKELYDNEVKPLLVIVNSIDDELKSGKELTEEEVFNRYTTLITMHNEIKKSNEIYVVSSKKTNRDFVTGVLSGIVGTGVAGSVLIAIYKTVKK